MADATGTTEVPNIEINTDKLNSSVASLNTAIDKFSGVLSAIPGSSSFNISNMRDQTEAVSKSVQKLGSSINLTNASVSGLQNAFSKISLSGAANELRKLEGTPVFSSLTKQFSSMMSFMSKNSEKFKDILGGGALVAGAIGAAKAMKAIDDATGLFGAEKNLRELQQTVMQLNTALQGVGAGSTVSFNNFNRNLMASMVLTNTTKEEILKLKQSLGEAFGAEEMDTILRVSGAMDNFRGSLTATNAAILISKATGTDMTQIANFMSDAVLQLGEDTDGAALALGRISQSAEKSGMRFDKVMGSIKSSTESLKMWGGTIGAVSPLFDMFSRSLSAGQKGLAPELLQKFAGGLQNMSTGVKGFLGLRAGMGGAGGGIGAALEMEEAMSKGPEGMKKVVDSLTQTLGQLGGGKIITRTEAVRDPTMQANFLMQRQLLGKMVGLDEASATKTLDALSKIQQGGMDITDQSNKNFAELIGMGEKVAQETTDPMLSQEIKTTAATIQGSKDIVDAVGSLGAKLDVAQSIKGLQDALDRSIVSGQIDPSDYMREINRAAKEKDTAKERVNEMRQSGRQPTTAQIGRLDKADQRESELKTSQQMFESFAQKFADAIQTEDLTAPETVAMNVSGKIPDRILQDLVSELKTQGKSIPDNITAAIENGINIKSKTTDFKPEVSDLSRMMEDMLPKNAALPQLPLKPVQRQVEENVRTLPEPVKRQMGENIRPPLPEPIKRQMEENILTPLKPVQRQAEENIQIPRLQTLNVENLSIANLARDLVNNANLKSNFPQVSAAINATGAAKREITNMQQTPTQTERVNKVVEEREVIITVKMDGDGTIKLKPLIEKIIDGKFKYNRES
jgi:hypothetical protein